MRRIRTRSTARRRRLLRSAAAAARRGPVGSTGGGSTAPLPPAPPPAIRRMSRSPSPGGTTRTADPLKGVLAARWRTPTRQPTPTSRSRSSRSRTRRSDQDRRSPCSRTTRRTSSSSGAAATWPPRSSPARCRTSPLRSGWISKAIGGQRRGWQVDGKQYGVPYALRRRRLLVPQGPVRPRPASPRRRRRWTSSMPTSAS